MICGELVVFDPQLSSSLDPWYYFNPNNFFLEAGYRLQYYNNDNSDFAKRSVNTIVAAGTKLVDGGEMPSEAFTFAVLRGINIINRCGCCFVNCLASM